MWPTAPARHCGVIWEAQNVRWSGRGSPLAVWRFWSAFRGLHDVPTAITPELLGRASTGDALLGQIGDDEATVERLPQGSPKDIAHTVAPSSVGNGSAGTAPAHHRIDKSSPDRINDLIQLTDWRLRSAC